ncbi:hypothetical protein D0815_23565 [Vibrio parahaemolyticus]|jgi:hypothetical protein|nr:hypothetical protein [Vibrio parahaemolyticus]EJL6388228.1 hypothetical protein [Vibrio parahaemolyticus]
MKLQVLLSKKLKAQVKNGLVDDNLVISMYNNFVRPVSNGFEVNELAGKYKPSWAYSGKTSSNHQEWLNRAEANSLHHYHVGHLFYRDGRDPDYPGSESDGLIHTTIRQSAELQTHIVFRADASHPIPFSFSYNPETDFATE